MTIRARLFGLAGIATGAALVMAVVGYAAATLLVAALDRTTVLGEAQRRFMACDMMHDAVRSDVLAAMYAGVTKDTKIAAVQTQASTDPAVGFTMPSVANER